MPEHDRGEMQRAGFEAKPAHFAAFATAMALSYVRPGSAAHRGVMHCVRGTRPHEVIKRL